MGLVKKAVSFALMAKVDMNNIKEPTNPEDICITRSHFEKALGEVCIHTFFVLLVYVMSLIPFDLILLFENMYKMFQQKFSFHIFTLY